LVNIEKQLQEVESSNQSWTAYSDTDVYKYFKYLQMHHSLLLWKSQRKSFAVIMLVWSVSNNPQVSLLSNYIYVYMSYFI